MLNRVILMGRLTADPELKQTQSGVSVTGFTIAVDRNYTPQGAERQADFINCVAWRNTAEFICRFFTKGRMMAVEGTLQVRNYTDKNDNKRQAVEVVVDQAYFADSKSTGTPGNDSAFTGTTIPTAPIAFNRGSDADFQSFDDDDVDLPF